MILHRAGARLKAFYKHEAQHRKQYQEGFLIGLVFGLLWELRYLISPYWQ